MRADAASHHGDAITACFDIIIIISDRIPGRQGGAGGPSRSKHQLHHSPPVHTWVGRDPSALLQHVCISNIYVERPRGEARRGDAKHSNGRHIHGLQIQRAQIQRSKFKCHKMDGQFAANFTQQSTEFWCAFNAGCAPWHHFLQPCGTQCRNVLM
jgi:hypothetical protein